MKEWIKVKTFRLFCPYFASIFVGCEALECFQPLRKVVSHYKGVPVTFTVRELNAVISQNMGKFIGNSGNQIAQKFGGDHLCLPFMQFHICRF